MEAMLLCYSELKLLVGDLVMLFSPCFSSKSAPDDVESGHLAHKVLTYSRLPVSLRSCPKVSRVSQRASRAV